MADGYTEASLKMSSSVLFGMRTRFWHQDLKKIESAKFTKLVLVWLCNNDSLMTGKRQIIRIE